MQKRFNDSSDNAFDRAAARPVRRAAPMRLLVSAAFWLLAAWLLTSAVSAQGSPPSYDPAFDVDGSCAIDLVDIQLVAAHWHGALPQYQIYDVNDDGVIDVLDVQLVAARWNTFCSTALPYPVVFVSRQILPEGSIYWNVPGGMPGVGPFSRFAVAAPGKLQVLEPGGALRTLVDGSQPSGSSLNLIDVNAPDVSYDGQRIVFAGIAAGQPSNAWRIYSIDVDGSDLRQVTITDLDYGQLDMSQFGNVNFGPYGDFDPAWLPDGRIVFSSTRWPSYGQYSGVRSSNLHVVNADGTGMRRITSERNGAERPLVDPITGKIVYSRWWRNHRAPVDSMATIPDPAGGYIQHLGLTTNPADTSGGPAHMTRNSWQLATINPDGTALAMWGGRYRDIDISHAYGGGFEPDGDLIANYFPMYNMTEAAGFGGLRRYHRGPGVYEPIIGVTWLTLDYVYLTPPSYGIFHGNYASEPDVLPDGRIVFSWAADVAQDYGLYVVNSDGSQRTLLYDNPGATELRARVVRPRPLPPIIPDTATYVPGPLPPPANGPYNQEGSFVFNALNVYFNGPVDFAIVNAPAVGSAETLRFFMDQQRTSPGSFPNLDWPILLTEKPVDPDGSVLNPAAPASAPLFEQLRASGGQVPLTFGPGSGGNDPTAQVPLATGGPLDIEGAGHVAGMNFGQAGEVQRCVGCHAGHTMIPTPASDEAARWTNLATGAEVTVSSTRDANQNSGLIDRRVLTGNVRRYWSSAANQWQNQWVKLTFPVPVTVRTVRLYNPRPEAGNVSIAVQQATVRLYSDYAATNQVATATTGPLAVSGTDLPFNDVLVRSIRVEINSVTGTFLGSRAASLAEIEVIARGEAGP